MEDRNETDLRKAMRQMIDDHGLRKDFDEVEIRQAWDEVCGAMIARHTESVRLQRRKAWVKVSSSPLRQELSYRKEELISKLNERIGRKVIEAIVLE